MSSCTAVEVAKYYSNLISELKGNIVVINKGAPKIWVSFGTKANKKSQYGWDSQTIELFSKTYIPLMFIKVLPYLLLGNTFQWK